VKNLVRRGQDKQAELKRRKEKLLSDRVLIVYA
jgi:hypothetical protein